MGHSGSDLDIFHKFDFAGSQITAHDSYVRQSEGILSEFNLQGNFEEKQYESCRFWSFWFKHFEDPGDIDVADLTGSKMIFFDICPEGEFFLVKMIVETNNDTKEIKTNLLEITFRCRDVRPYYFKYKGMSYRNLYGTEDYQKTVNGQKYVLDEQFLMRKEEFILPDGYSVETALYQDATQYRTKAYLQKCVLKKSGKTIYEYLCTYNHGARFKDFILHSNGRRYFPFHVDLYGISYLDIDSLESYHYVPEGYAHDFSYPCGESFIVTDIHYDKDTDLIAYGGCYWAGPSGVMAGDFSEPLNFAPRLFNIGEIVDPDSEGYDIDFKQWQDGKLIVTVEGEEKMIPVERIIEAIGHAGRKT